MKSLLHSIRKFTVNHFFDFAFVCGDVAESQVIVLFFQISCCCSFDSRDDNGVSQRSLRSFLQCSLSDPDRKIPFMSICCLDCSRLRPQGEQNIPHPGYRPHDLSVVSTRITASRICLVCLQKHFMNSTVCFAI